VTDGSRRSERASPAADVSQASGMLRRCSVGAHGSEIGGAMATTAMVDSYVRHLLEEEHGEDVQALDGSYVLAGDHPVRIWVVDGNHRSRRVLVTAVVLEDVDVDTELLEAVNALNAVTVYGRFFALDDSVHVEDTVLADVLDPASLFNSIGFVRWAAQSQADELRERLGVRGSVPAPTSGSDGVQLDGREELDLVDPGRSVSDRSRAEAISAGGYL
jgi:hypothetical protein